MVYSDIWINRKGTWYANHFKKLSTHSEMQVRFLILKILPFQWKPANLKLRVWGKYKFSNKESHYASMRNFKIKTKETSGDIWYVDPN